jgi:hypothetical protein
MKFLIKNGKEIGQQQLVYLTDECSFYTGRIAHKIDMELIVNKISLAVSDDKIVDVNGFCGFAEWMKSDYKVPKYKKGVLKVEHNLKYGLAYGINDIDFPMYVNTQTGWICIGNPEKSGQAVEFINNCVAVIDDDNKFVSLWLKPKSLPNI